MELRVTGKNVDVSDVEREYIDKKLTKLTHHLPDITESLVEVTREGAREPQNRYVVQVTVNIKGTLLRAEERAPLLAMAIDNVTAALDRQIERFKGRRHAKGRRAAERTEAEAATVLEEAEAATMFEESEPNSRLVRTKRFSVKPMSTDEAIEQMELLGHAFFLFLNSNSQQYNVVYRRRDGDYALIEPQVG